MNANEAVRRLAEVIRRKHLALATERTCFAWLRRFFNFLNGRPFRMPSEHKLERFLTDPAQKDAAASTQIQAFSTINSRMGARQDSSRLTLILTFSPWEKEQTSPASAWAPARPANPSAGIS